MSTIQSAETAFTKGLGNLYSKDKYYYDTKSHIRYVEPVLQQFLAYDHS